MATKPHREVPRPCVPPVWFFLVLHTAPEHHQLFLNPLQYYLSLENSGTKGLRELPRDCTEECVSNLGMELLSPKTLSGSVLSGLCQTFFGCAAAAGGVWAFPSQAFTL